MSDARFNGWQVLALVLILLFAFGCAWATMKVMIPAAVAQIGSNIQIVNQVNTAFQERDKRLDKCETRLDSLEKRGK
jgi:uncharacterized glyoxalase superfamily metalloenzyme YdcJ